MNERIKELYDKVVGDDKLNLDSYLAEKFAQLIVRECVELFPERHYYYSGPAVKRNIKNHFGVKE
jgi:hypothetical protein